MPKGQVLLRVNGEDITRRDLMIEAQANGLPADVKLDAVRQGLLDAIVDRQLAAAEALRLGLDTTPEYQADLRRTRALLLRTALERRLAEQIPAPTEREAAAFVAANPHIFAAHKLYRVDGVLLPAGMRKAAARELAATRFDAVAGWPRAQVSMIDSATLSAPEARLVERSTSAAPALLTRGRDLWIVVARDAVSVPAPSPEQQWRQAVQMLARARSDKAVADYLASLRKVATVVEGTAEDEPGK